MNTLDHALEYHRRGFPLVPLVKGYKAPARKGWTALRPSPQSEAEVRRLFGSDVGIGLLTGGPGGYVVIDQDVKHGKQGPAQWQRYKEERGITEQAPQHGSPSGGLHDIYRLPPGVSLPTRIGCRLFGEDSAIDVMAGLGSHSNLVLPPTVLIGDKALDGKPQTPGPYTVEIAADVPMIPPVLLADLLALPAVNPKSDAPAVEWTEIDDTHPEWPARVALLEKLMREESLYLEGQSYGNLPGGLRYVALIQRAGPGLLLPCEIVWDRFWSIYNPRLPEEHRWRPEHEDVLMRHFTRAYRLGFASGAQPDDQWPATKQRKIMVGVYGAEAADRLMAAEQAPADPSAAVHEYTFDPLKDPLVTQWIPKRDGKGAIVKQEDGTPRMVPKPLGKPPMSDLVRAIADHPDWVGVFRYNELDYKTYATRPPFKMSAEHGEGALPDEDLAALQTWCQVKLYADPFKTELASAVNLIAMRNRYNPVQQYLSGLPAATTNHLESLASVLFGDDRPIAQAYVRKALIAACARAFEPGCRVDTVLTLVGPKGGEKKSTTIEELFAISGYDVFRTDLPDLADAQKVGQALEGCWVAELAELAVAKKNDVEAVKSTLTRKSEKYSPKYIRGEVTRPRRCVFWASTNEETFLPRHDPAFRRRFWPVHAKQRVDMAWLRANREQIWSEAFELYTSGEAWWFESEREADAGRAEFIREDSWEQVIQEAIANLAPLEGGGTERFVTAKDIWSLVHPLDAKPPSGQDFAKVLAVMNGLNYEYKRVNSIRGYMVPITKKRQRVAEETKAGEAQVFDFDEARKRVR